LVRRQEPQEQQGAIHGLADVPRASKHAPEGISGHFRAYLAGLLADLSGYSSEKRSRRSLEGQIFLLKASGDENGVRSAGYWPQAVSYFFHLLAGSYRASWFLPEREKSIDFQRFRRFLFPNGKSRWFASSSTVLDKYFLSIYRVFTIERGCFRRPDLSRDLILPRAGRIGRGHFGYTEILTLPEPARAQVPHPRLSVNLNDFGALTLPDRY
jgi:hypothetical protein